MNRALIFEFLRRNRYAVVSSLSGAGAPQSALVGIAVTPDLEVVFDALKSSRKTANLTARPACSLVVGGWSGEQTVQYEGEAFEPAGEERTRYLETYFEAWPGGRERMQQPGITHFVVRPRWVRYSDFDQQPPLVQEFNFPV
ncbi:MAG TPA: pyridoxamine 5'-phosphate oxidase family protein [Acidobacteriaceae bacterium]|nr:pyridoxamine 5'-phosphate oxidase family protein [Acidobacteriaceae bacterium]